MHLKIMKNQVLVKLLPFNFFRQSSIIITPDVADRNHAAMYGIVEMYGDGYRSKKGGIHKVDVKEGDVVVFGRFNGYRLMVDQIEYRILNAYDIFAVIEEE